MGRPGRPREAAAAPPRPPRGCARRPARRPSSREPRRQSRRPSAALHRISCSSLRSVGLELAPPPPAGAPGSWSARSIQPRSGPRTATSGVNLPARVERSRSGPRPSAPGAGRGSAARCSGRCGPRGPRPGPPRSARTSRAWADRPLLHSRDSRGVDTRRRATRARCAGVVAKARRSSARRSRASPRRRSASTWSRASHAPVKQVALTCHSRRALRASGKSAGQVFRSSRPPARVARQTACHFGAQTARSRAASA